MKFTFKYVENKEGDFINLTTGLSIGKHNGIHQWTLGQRCRIGGKEVPYFVYKSDSDNNIIYVVSKIFLTVNLEIIFY